MNEIKRQQESVQEKGLKVNKTEYVTCPICKAKLKTLGFHCTRIHRMSKEQVLELYPDTQWSSEKFFEVRSKICKGIVTGNRRRVQNINWEHVKELILEGKSSFQIAEIVNCSYPTIMKYTETLYPELRKKLRENGFNRKADGGRNARGGLGLKGRTYEEIFKTKEEVERRKRITSDWMKTKSNIRRYCKHPSKPQIELFKKVKQKYPDAILEYPIKLNIGNTIWLDVAVPSLKLDYEFDGIYWHKVNQNNGKMTDKSRDKFLIELGWDIIRFTEGDEIKI